MESPTSPKLYRLQNDPSHFYAGQLPDCTHVFMAHDWSHFLGIFFDAEGKYLRHTIRGFSQVTQSLVDDYFRLRVRDDLYEATSREAYAKVQGDLDRWVAELGSHEGTIAVQKFCLPDHEVSIHDLFLIYEEMIDEGEVDEETKAAIEGFQASGHYVFVCFGEEFEISSGGEVVST